MQSVSAWMQVDFWKQAILSFSPIPVENLILNKAAVLSHSSILFPNSQDDSSRSFRQTAQVPATSWFLEMRCISHTSAYYQT